MKIDIDNFPRIWLEDEEGNKFTKIYTEGGEINSPFPKKFKYMHSLFADRYASEVLKLIYQEDVDKCDHSKYEETREYKNRLGIEERECRNCGGKQQRKIGEMWPEKWEGYGSRSFYTMQMSWSNDLVTAIVRSGDYNAEEAVLIASNCCERCFNVLYDKYGLEGGYKEGSEKWSEELGRRSVPKCEFCKNDVPILVALKYYETKENE